MELLLLQTPRLRIRNLKVSDLEDFHSYRSMPEVIKYQGLGLMDKSQAMAFIDQQKDKLFGKPGEWVQYGIEEKLQQQLIGDCAIKLQAADPRIAEIGITLHPDFQRKGFAKEAMLEILRFLFQDKQLHRVVETVDAENAASINLLERLHFRKEGHFIENIFFKGKWGSELQYAMLRREWLELRTL